MVKREKLPKTHKALEALLEERRRVSYNSGYSDASTAVKNSFKQQEERLMKEYDANRQRAIASLSRMGEALAQVATSLSKVVEPR